VEEDVGQMEGGGIQAPDFKIQPVRERRQGSIKLTVLAGFGAIFVKPFHTAEGTEQEALQESLAQDILVFADEILIVPEEISLHGREENEQVERQKEKDRYQEEEAGSSRALGR
jgi:hypothetical protein